MGANGNAANDRVEIQKIRQDIETAENAGDVAAFGEHLADEVAMLPASGPRHAGIDDVVAFHRDHFDTYDIDVSFSIDTITILGDLAVEHGTYTATLSPVDGGEPRDGGGEYLYVYERQPNEDWKIMRMSW